MTESEAGDGKARSMSGAGKTTFLETARRRRSTPERLDRTLSVTPARGWIALLSIFAAASAVVAWSVVGEVATYVEAHGFLLNRGGKVVDATANGHGWLTEISVAVGDEIEKGAVVASIENEQVSARHASALALVEERTRTFDALKISIAEESRAVRANNARRRGHLDELEATARKTLQSARASLENGRRLFDERVVTRSYLRRAEQEFNDARRALLELSRDRGNLEASEIAYENEKEIRIGEAAAEVEAAKRRASELGGRRGGGKSPGAGRRPCDRGQGVDRRGREPRRGGGQHPYGNGGARSAALRPPPPKASRSRRECRRWYRPSP